MSTISQEKLYDIITRTPIEDFYSTENSENGRSNNISALYYIAKFPAQPMIVKELIKSLNEDDVKIYRSGINSIRHNYQLLIHNLEKPRYYRLELSDTSESERREYPIYAREVGGRMVEYITSTPIHCAETDCVKLNLTYDEAISLTENTFKIWMDSFLDETSYEKYDDYLKNKKHETVLKYNNYMTVEAPVISKKRVKSKTNN